MDIQAYISSGILELYLSGQLSPDEAAEVERMAQQHPAIRNELDALELALEEVTLASFDATPSPGLLDNIMQQIAKPDATSIEAPIRPLHENLDPAEPKFSAFPWRWIAVAAAVALLLSLAFNIQQYQQLRDAQNQIAGLNQQQEQFAEQLQQTADQFAVLSDANSQIVDLQGLDLAPEAQARVYWQAETRKVLFQMSNLPSLSEEQVFQLWAIIDGQPVDAGLMLADGSLQLAKPISGEVSAFAVTIEPSGGSSAPTLDQMVLYGEA
ncbi:MAG: anti-sigma factor [Bacteroidota bacterium]